MNPCAIGKFLTKLLVYLEYNLKYKYNNNSNNNTYNLLIIFSDVYCFQLNLLYLQVKVITNRTTFSTHFVSEHLNGIGDVK